MSLRVLDLPNESATSVYGEVRSTK